MNFKNLFGLTCVFGLMAASSAFALPKATEIYPKMGLGYNIGNTMEVPGSQGGPTGWGNSFPDAAYVKAIKDAGFNTVRIPCAWDSHASNGTINAGWLDSVKTVVDLVINNGMYAILNSHWDGGWLEDHVFDGEGYDKTGLVNSSAAAVAAKQESYWKQIATKFAAYDEHLIFASANEPGVNDPRNGGADNGQWAFDEKRMKVLKQFHEVCIKAVRSTGGNNATRIVVVQAPRTEIDKSPLLASMYPEDPAGAGYTMAEIHFYPYQFSLKTDGDTQYDWGTMNEFYYWEDQTPGNDAAHTCSGSALGSKSSIDQLFSGLKSRFYDNGIPVVIGEMGAVKRLGTLTGENLKTHLKARAAWYGYTVAAAKKNGLVPCVWDTGDEGDGNFTIIRRQVNRFGGNVGDITDVETLNSMREAYGQASLPGNTIDSLVNENPDIPETEEGKGVQLTYQTVTSDSSEVGTLRINLASGKNNLSKYVGIEIRLKGSVETAGGCTGAGDGCGEYGWTSMDLFMMTGSSWAWFDAPVLQQADQELNASQFQTIQVKWEDFRTEPTDLNLVNAIGLNLYGTQVTGTITFDYIKGIKADGSTEIIDDFDKKPQIEGIATAKVVSLSGTSAIKPASVAATSKMFVNVQPGFVNATFSAKGNVQAKAMLMNSMGQVIASESFMTRSGNNTVQLKADYRGPAMLVIKQGSQVYSQKVILK